MAEINGADFPAQWGSNIPNVAFAGQNDLRELVVPESIKKIGISAFASCSGLKELTLPASLTEICDQAFSGCSGLTRVTFAANNLQWIRAGCFRGCTSLVELELPTSVHMIGGCLEGGAFEGCTNLRTLILPPALVTLGEGAFKGSMSNLRMLVVPPESSDKVVATMAAMVGPRKGKAAASLVGGGWAAWAAKKNPTQVQPVLFSAISAIQLVSAPDAVVAALGGKFAAMATMAEARGAGRAVVSRLEHHYWTIKTHKYHVCTPMEQLCAHTVMLVGNRLDGSQASCTPASLPDELWVMILGWVLRHELGGGT
jgi:hypothetical protein